VVETTGCQIKPVETGSWGWMDQPILIGLNLTDPGFNPGRGGVEDQSWPGNLSKVDYAEGDSLRLVSGDFGLRHLWLKPQSVRSNLLKQVHGYGWINRF